jgi:putative spermidine/putrescine transport system permease protein
MRYLKLKPYLMVFPVSLLLGLFVYSLINGLVQSFGILPAAGLTKFTLLYYKEVFSRRDMMSSIFLSIYISLVSSLVAVILGIFISAIALGAGIVKKRSFQILKLPVILPHTVSALLILTMFSQSGILSRVCYHLGIIHSQEQFISLVFDNGSIGIIFAYLWKEIPFVILMVVTIMANIDSSLGEAAVNLGATKLKVFLNITFPLCLPTALTSFIIVFAYSFGAFEIPFLLGTTAPKALPVLTYIEYTYPDLAHRPYAMVLNTFMMATSMLLTYIYYKILQRNIKKVGGDSNG